MLRSYYKNVLGNNLYTLIEESIPFNNSLQDSDIVQKNDDEDLIENVNFYISCDSLEKEVIYNDAEIVQIKYRKNNICYIEEYYDNDFVRKKCRYDSKQRLIEEIEYEYNHLQKLCGIKKKRNNDEYYIQYLYNDFDQVCGRKIYINWDLILSQKVRFNIFDKIVEYQDSNYNIVVGSTNKKNELLQYSMQGNLSGNIEILNNFSNSKYENTSIAFNNQTHVFYDRSYLHNELLSNISASEDDFENVWKEFFGVKTDVCEQLHDDSYTNCLNLIASQAESSLKNIKVLPISIRKMALYNKYIQDVANAG